MPLVEVSLISNLMPLFTALLGFWLLKEAISKLDILTLLVSFAGIVVLIMGGEQSEGSATERTRVIIATILLMFVPVLNASGNIALR